MNWNDYFEKNRGRPLRPLFLRALETLAATKIAKAHGANEIMAVELGCGAGIETAHLLSQGWKVFAVDGEPTALDSLKSTLSPDILKNLNFEGRPFEELGEIVNADFVFSYHALPFCREDRLFGLLKKIAAAVRTDGVFAGTFFGPKDQWVLEKKASGLTMTEITAAFAGFTVLHQNEIDELAPTALQGMKHWHVFEVILRLSRST